MFPSARKLLKNKRLRLQVSQFLHKIINKKRALPAWNVNLHQLMIKINLKES